MYAGELWKPYWRGTASSPNYGALVLTSCPVGNRLIGGVNQMPAQECIACADDEISWPAWTVTLEPLHMRLGFKIEWQSSAGRLCRQDRLRSYSSSYTLVKLESSKTGNETILTRFGAGGQQQVVSINLNVTKANFVVRLKESVSATGEVSVGLKFSGHNLGHDGLIFDLGCTWTEPPSWEEFSHIVNIFKKNVLVQGAGVKSVEALPNTLRRGRGHYLSQTIDISKPSEEYAGSARCLPCPAGAICLKGMFIPNAGTNQMLSHEWGSTGTWEQEQETGLLRLIACPENYTKFPFDTTLILDKMMQISMQSCVQT